MNRATTLVWLLLMLLTSVSYALGGRSDAVLHLLTNAGLKFALVAWYFMELRHASKCWSFIFAGFLLLFLGAGRLLT